MLVKELKITNSRGDSIQFGRHFFLLNDLDFSNLEADVSYSESIVDGANYQRTVLEIREFDIPFYLKRINNESWWYEERRRELFKVFNPKFNPMRLDFTTANRQSYFLNANLEATPSLPKGFENDNKVWQKGLLQFSCDDPFIYSADENKVDVAVWIGDFEFPLEIPEEGIELGHRSESLIANVYNDGDNETGMIIRFKALASVKNPMLINVNSYETLKLNFHMVGGDVIEVSTYRGKKSATLIRNNEKINIFNSIHLMSTFLQLKPGDNLFRYDADEGIDNLEVSMIFRNKFVGV